MNSTKYVSFYNSKGGVGKTLLNGVFAYYLKTIKGFKVAVVDCDHPQYTLYRRRTHEIKKEPPAEQEKIKFQTLQGTGILFSSGGERSYDVFKCPIEEVETLKSVLNKTSYDIVFFDVTGTLNLEGINKIIGMVNYFIIPTSTDIEEIDSSVRIYMTLKKAQKGKDDTIRILFNKAKKVSRVKNVSFQKELEKMNFRFLQNYCYEYEAIRDEYRSTLELKTTRDDKNASFHLIMEELLELLNL